jgi:flagellar export protein FliJ
MRKFRFRLQNLENIRGMELDALRQAMANAQAGLRRAEEELLDARDALDSTYNEVAQLRLERADPMLLLSLESYTGVMRDQVLACAQQVARRKAELREARERLVAKHKEKKVLEKYRERQHLKYSQYVERETQKELDETAKSSHKAGLP